MSPQTGETEQPCRCDRAYIGTQMAGEPIRCERCRGLVDDVARERLDAGYAESMRRLNRPPEGDVSQ